MMNRLFLLVVPLALNLCAEVRYERVPEGGIQPQIVQEASGRVHMIYFKGDPRGGDIFYVTKESARESFSPAERRCSTRSDGPSAAADREHERGDAPATPPSLTPLTSRR